MTGSTGAPVPMACIASRPARRVQNLDDPGQHDDGDDDEEHDAAPLLGDASPGGPGTRAVRALGLPGPSWRGVHRLAFVGLAVVGFAALILGVRQPAFRREAASRFLGLAAAGTSPSVGVGGAPAFKSSAATFQALDPDADGFVAVNGPDGTPLGAPMDFAQFQASAAAEKAEVALENGESPAVEASVNAMRTQGSSQGETVPTTTEVRVMGKRHAVVRELYTFGAPATTKAGIYDAQSPGGCFAGMRIVTQSPRFMQVSGTLRVESDPVPSLLDFAYKHALMDYLPASRVNVEDNTMKSCDFYKHNPDRLKDTPKWDNFWWVNGHMIYPSVLQAHYDRYHNASFNKQAPDSLSLMTKERRLQAASKPYYDLTEQEKIDRARIMAHLTFMDYAEQQQDVMDQKEFGWTFVARANAASDVGAASGMLGFKRQGDARGKNAQTALRVVNTFYDGLGDHMLLYQHQETLECVMIFEGSNRKDMKDWFANFNFASTPFCGFGPTHQGFRAKIMRMVGGIDYRQVIRRKIAHCSAVTVTGHSLGGAQAELFAGCANHPLQPGEPGYLDFRLLSLPQLTGPTRMESFMSDHADGSFIRNKGNQLCIDVQGTMNTVYTSQVIMYNCELPDSTYSLDQKWKLTSEGFIVNSLSGKCIDGNVTDTAVAQYSCEYGMDESDQKWEFTADGFLRNQLHGKCLDSNMQLYDCPYTEQKWKITAEGFVVNQLSGKCLDVMGSPGTAAGTPIVLWPCETGAAETDQRWELYKGRLKNKLSGKCIVEQLAGGTEVNANLVLGSCSASAALAKGLDSWQINPGGFIRNMDTSRCLTVKGDPGVANGSSIIVEYCQDKGIYTTGLWRMDPQGYIVNLGSSFKLQHKCLEIFGTPWNETAKTMDGAELFLDYCEVNTDQKWEFARNGMIRNVIGGQKCLSVAQIDEDASIGDQRLFWIDNCVDVADPALFLESKWKRLQNGQLVNKFSRRCMAAVEHGEHHHAEGALGDVAAKVSPAMCESTHGNALWDFLGNGSVVNRDSGMCLDVGGPGLQGNVPLDLRPCDAVKKAQQWKLTAQGLLQNGFSGQCVGQFFDAATPEEVRLLVKPCPKASQQLWKFLQSGQILNEATGKCLDTPRPGQTLLNGESIPFYMLTEYTCDATIPTQLWETIKTPRVTAVM